MREHVLLFCLLGLVLTAAMPSSSRMAPRLSRGLTPGSAPRAAPKESNGDGLPALYLRPRITSGIVWRLGRPYRSEAPMARPSRSNQVVT